MRLTAVDSLVTRQVFITGLIQDALSGRPTLNPAAISLQFQAAPQRPYPLQLRQAPGGFYAFFGDPHTALPVLTAPDTLDLQLVVTAARYQPATIPISLTAAELGLAELSRTIEGQAVMLPRRTGLPRTIDIALLPLPLSLVGRVVHADDPAEPVVGAAISVTAPGPAGPVTSGANGNYSLTNLPIAEEITVVVTHPSFSELTTTLRLDYRQPVNEQHFSLA
jgi:hypothetical protein